MVCKFFDKFDLVWGMVPITVMKLTGHKDLKTLMKYENTSEQALVEALGYTSFETINI